MARACNLVKFGIHEPSVNLSDHRPIFANVYMTPMAGHTSSTRSDEQASKIITEPLQLRWDHADLIKYYDLTGMHVQGLLFEFNQNLECLFRDEIFDENLINDVYEKLIIILNNCASLSVPQNQKGFYKFWWDQELDILKEESINSHNLWKLAGRPRNGQCFNKYRSDKLAYKLRIRKGQEEETTCYTNDLHEALMTKHGRAFWNCWRSKLGNNDQKPIQVDGLTDATEIANRFACQFQKNCTSLTVEGNNKLKDTYHSKRDVYQGKILTCDSVFDAESIENVLSSMKKGKAAGLDGLTVEHLQHCHPCLPMLLAKLFNLIMQVGKVPDSFGLSYTIPLLKVKTSSMSKSLSINDFRGISISPLISKLFENAILSKYEHYFVTSNNQFGFKKNSSVSHAIYSVRQAVNKFVNSGSTVNLCALDVSKAFDKVNHYGLFIKLMERAIPNELLSIFENWFKMCASCIRWGSAVSRFVSFNCGVRQGGVLSPHLFAIYIDDVINKISSNKHCCKVRFTCVSVFMYADDLLLLSPSVTYLQSIIRIAEEELANLDMSINANKSTCVRIGPRYNVKCSDITTYTGNLIPWVNTCRYLGVFFVSHRVFKCDYDDAKKKLFRTFNAIFGKIGRLASADVTIHMLQAKCLPSMLYGLEACPINSTESKSFEFALFRVYCKIFGTFSKDFIEECCFAFGIHSISIVIIKRKLGFLNRYAASMNIVCGAFQSEANHEIKVLKLKLQKLLND